MPLSARQRLRTLMPSLFDGVLASRRSHELRGIYFEIHLAAGAIGALIGLVWGGPAEWFTAAASLLLLAFAAAAVRYSPVATLLMHSMLVLLLMDVYLAQPDALPERWQVGLLAPAVAAALSCFWLGVYGGWLGGLAGVLLALALLCDSAQSRVAAALLLSLMVALGQAHGALHRRLLAARRRLHRDALTDPATGLYNRRALERALPRLRAAAARNQQPLLLTLWDLDGLKMINDTWGHAAGDAVLASFTTALRESARAADSLFRVGGDEFVGLHAGLSDGALLVARVRQRFPMVSAGWAEDDGAALLDLKEAADRKLYADKAQRRGTRRSKAGMAALVRSVTRD